MIMTACAQTQEAYVKQFHFSVRAHCVPLFLLPEFDMFRPHNSENKYTQICTQHHYNQEAQFELWVEVWWNFGVCSFSMRNSHESLLLHFLLTPSSRLNSLKMACKLKNNNFINIRKDMYYALPTRTQLNYLRKNYTREKQEFSRYLST